MTNATKRFKRRVARQAEQRLETLPPGARCWTCANGEHVPGYTVDCRLLHAVQQGENVCGWWEERET